MQSQYTVTIYKSHGLGMRHRHGLGMRLQHGFASVSGTRSVTSESVSRQMEHVPSAAPIPLQVITHTACHVSYNGQPIRFHNIYVSISSFLSHRYGQSLMESSMNCPLGTLEESVQLRVDGSRMWDVNQ